MPALIRCALFGAEEAPEGWFASRFDHRDWPDIEIVCADQAEIGSDVKIGGAKSMPDVALIGPHLAQPLAVARMIRQLRPSAQIIFLLPSERLERFLRMLPFVPEVAGSRAINANAPAAEVRNAIEEAIAQAKRELELRGLYNRLNAQLSPRVAGPAAADAAESERRHRHLVLAERYLATILAHVPDALFATDVAGTIVAWNDAAARLFGVLWDDATGRLATEFVVPASRGRLSDLLKRVALGQTVQSFEVGIELEGRSPQIVELGAAPILAGDGAIEGISFSARDVTERKRWEQQQALLIRELHHRVRNILATVQAVMRSTFRSAYDINEYYTALSGRIVSLARTHDLLTENEWQTATLRDLLTRELDPYEDGSGRIRMRGPDVALRSDLAMPLSMAFHELTTNAAKYGALSAPGGCVETVWDIRASEGGEELVFEWVESGGPPVTLPSRHGFGSALLHRVLAVQLQAEVDIAFNPGGVRFSMVMPSPSVSRARR